MHTRMRTCSHRRTLVHARTPAPSCARSHLHWCTRLMYPGIASMYRKHPHVYAWYIASMLGTSQIHTLMYRKHPHLHTSAHFLRRERSVTHTHANGLSMAAGSL
eukprot:6196979-Pleurochrysis_carterae.AAC.3